jgi:Uma2 family endonuclease
MSTIARLSIEQYDRMIQAGVFDEPIRRRIEFIRGELREMNPIGSAHECLVDILTEWSILSLPTRSVWVRVQNSIGLPTLESAPEPDIAWVTRKDFTYGRPTSNEVLLMIEVSDSSLKYDRGEKAELYAAAGIADYWVVNIVDELVEVMREPVGGKFSSVETYGAGASVTPLRYPEISLLVDMLFPRDDV